MNLTRRRPAGRGVLTPEQRTTKAIAVTPELWRALNLKRGKGDTFEDVLRRELHMPPR